MNLHLFLCLIIKSKFKSLFKNVFGKKLPTNEGDNNSAEKIVEVQRGKVSLALLGHQSQCV